jgi:DNA-binding IclR family transcriptional regulator
MAATHGDLGDPRGPDRTVLGRIACVMEAFNGGEHVLGLSDLNKLTRLPKSTLHRLAEQLCQVGWLERDCGGYRVGMRLFELGNLAIEGSRLQEVALPHLQALAGRCGTAVQLAVLDRGEVVYLERVVMEQLRLPTRRGGRKPAHCTALGKAMLAFDEEAVRSLVSSPLPRWTPKTIVDPAALRTELAHVRDTGVAFDRGESYEHLVCVAAPVRGPGRAIGAVSVTGLAGRMRWNAAAEAVRSTATAIWNATFSMRGPGGARM